MLPFKETIPDDYEIWVIAGYIGQFPLANRAFECHSWEVEYGDVWEEFMNDPWCDLYVPEYLINTYPKASLIPCDEFFPDYGSTISYMIAQAVKERVDEIRLFGVGMCDEYEHQRPSAFYWLGVANGLGIKTGGLMKEVWYGRT